MSTLPFLTYAFSTGEMAPPFYSRTDLVTYDLGLSLAMNGFIDYRGGFSSRAGFMMREYVAADTQATRLVRFKNGGNDLVLLFGDMYMRVLENGAYALEASKAVTGLTQAATAVCTSTAHGFSNGDWVKISGVVGMTEVNGRTFQVTSVTANTFGLQTPTGTAVDSTGYAAYTSGGTVSRVYTLATLYAAADLASVKFDQKHLNVFITSLAYSVHRLTFASVTSWTLAEETFASAVAAPIMPTLTPSAAGTAGVGLAVSAVNVDGEESQISRMAINELSVDYTATAGSIRANWTAVPDAVRYNLYRTLVLPVGSELTPAQELGYLGYALGPQFTDNNITPDFTKTPALHTNPFADSAVSSIVMTAAGAGYSKTLSTVSVTGGGGSGFAGYPIVDASGTILGVVVTNGGSGYVSPVLSFAGPGAGATGTVNLTAASGNNPAASISFQQRRVYAGTVTYPAKIWGSLPAHPGNMDVSVEITPGDAYSFELDDTDTTPIQHLVVLRSGLLLFSRTGVTRITGSKDRSVNGTSAIAEPQEYKGVSNVSPMAIGNDIIFTQADGTALQSLVYTYYSNSFAAQDLSLFSNHLLGRGKKIIEMAWAEAPFKLVYLVREDGKLLTYTYLRDQKVFALTQNETRGFFRNVVSVKESDIDVVYTVVERLVQGRWTKFVEQQADRRQTYAEDYFCVDCGMESEKAYPAATLTPSSGIGAATLTASAAVFAATDVDGYVFAGGGKLLIDTYVSGTEVSGTWERAMTAVQPESTGEDATEQAAGTWYIMGQLTALTGLWHLEGETVRVVGDGSDLGDFTVSGGTVTLSRAVTKARVGYPFTYRGKTLPLTTKQMMVEGRRKNVKGVAVRVHETRGLKWGSVRKVGDSPVKLYEMKDRTNVPWSTDMPLRSEMATVSIDAAWERDGSLYWEQPYALPATVLGLVVDAEIGDT